MFKLIQAFKTARLLSDYIPTHPVTLTWELADRHALSAFLNTPTGQKFVELANRHTNQAASNACAQPVETRYHCGVAHGIRLAYSTIEQLQFRQSEAHSDTSTGDDSRIPEWANQ